jgi:SWI/SNF-related matrix-associated actin-dependent regulator 1 of chromatin subfamily A
LKLTFQQNHFVLHEADMGKFLGTAWKPHAQFAFKTANIQEAVRFRKHADNKAERIFKKLMLRRKPLPSGGLLSPITLLKFQEEKGVPFILSRNRSYLAHQPGLGKTAQAIVAVNTAGGNCFIVAPSFLKVTWAREITKWSYEPFPSIQIVPETSKRQEMDWSARFVICSDSMLIKPWVIDELAKRTFKFFFIDEAQRFKNHESSRTTALFGGRTKKVKSPGLIYKSEYVCALSGTPMLNRPIELWSLLYGMAPETIDFMPMQDYGFRFCGPWTDERGHWHFTGSSREDELNKRIMTNFMQRIRKEDVLKDLPEKVREVIFIDEDLRLKELKDLDRKLLRALEKSAAEIPQSLGEFAKLRHEIGLAKADWVAKFVSQYLDEGESIILFAHHRDVVDHLAMGLSRYKPFIVNGGVDNARRTYYQDQFQSGKCKLIVGNISAMNLGLTLTKATRVVFAEYDWTPANNEQAEDRAHRIGQHDSVFVQYIVLPNSLDERVLQRVLEKQETIGKVIG